MDTGPSKILDHLQRGKACLGCRRRKMRCDGEKPICGPCFRKNDDCQYTDRRGLSKTQALEEHLAYLKDQIHDLEHLAESSPSGLPPDPHPSQMQAQSLDIEPDLQSSTQRRSAIDLPPMQDSWWDLEEPPVQLRQVLLERFLPYLYDAGLFLNVPRFINAFYALELMENNSRPTQALLSAVYLWGISLSSLETLKSHESVFLERAIRHLASALSGDHPQKAKHALQAEVLLSRYYFWTGSLLEGRYHCNAAVSIAVSLRLHKIRSVQDLPSDITTVDMVEEGERIKAFWTVFVDDKCWAVALRLPSALPDPKTLDGRIDTPWPMEKAQYERGWLTSDIRSYGTIDTFLDNPGASSDEPSLPAIACKAAALMERASCFASTWTPNMPEVESTQFWSNFVALNEGIDAFHDNLSSIAASGDFNSHDTRMLIIARTLSRLGTVHLNAIFAHQDVNANSKCVEAAKAAVQLLDNIDLVKLGYLPLAMGNFLLECGQILIREIVQLRSAQTLSTDVFTLLSREEELTILLDKLEFSMLAAGVQMPIFCLQQNILSKAREERL